MAGNGKVINRVFSRKVIEELVDTGHNSVFTSVITRHISDPTSKTYGQIISEIYCYLGESNRNEYYYTNTLLNKLLVGKHNVNTTTALSQVRIGAHIADFVMINGEGCVYEIKSDLDNFERLSDQLYDYFKAFSKVSVLAPDHGRERVAKMLDSLGEWGEAVGIYGLTENDTIFSRTNERKPKEYNDFLDYRCIFTLLRKREYEHILYDYFGSLPVVPPVFYYKECLKMFEMIPISEAQRMTFKELKKRNRITRTDFQSIPSELKAVTYFTGLAKKIPNIENLWQRQYREE